MAKQNKRRRFGWRHDWQKFNGDPNAIGNRLEALQAERGGTLTPEQIVEEATHEDSPLHDCFDWDDADAARKWRLDQARSLIACITIISGPTATPVRAFVSITDPRSEQSAYMDTATALTSADVRQQILARALAEADQWRKRYEQLKELAGVFAALEATKTQTAAAA